MQLHICGSRLRAPWSDGGGYTPTLASRIACQTFIGVSGVARFVMPSSLSASITPLTRQGVPPMVPDSPQP